MVELMKNAWNGSMSFKSDKAMASYVLSKMEEVGILPPQLTAVMKGIPQTVRTAWRWDDE